MMNNMSSLQGEEIFIRQSLFSVPQIASRHKKIIEGLHINFPLISLFNISSSSSIYDDVIDFALNVVVLWKINLNMVGEEERKKYHHHQQQHEQRIEPHRERAVCAVMGSNKAISIFSIRFDF